MPFSSAQSLKVTAYGSACFLPRLLYGLLALPLLLFLLIQRQDHLCGLLELVYLLHGVIGVQAFPLRVSFCRMASWHPLGIIKRECEDESGDIRFMLLIPEKGSQNNLNFLRFLLAVLVILHHSYAIFGHSDPIEYLTRGAEAIGGCCVKGFFIISGYLIPKSYLASRNVGEYLQKRVLRIYPAFLLASVVCYLVVAPLGSDSFAQYRANVHPRQWFLQMLLLRIPRVPSAFTHTPFPGILSGSMWTISWEFLCYLMVIVLGRIKLLQNVWALCLLTSSALIVSKLFLLHPHAAQQVGVFTHLDNPSSGVFLIGCFCIGTLAFVLRDRLPRSPRLTACVLGSLLLSLAYPPVLFLLSPFAIGYLVFCFGYAPKPNLHNWIERTSGDLSYGVYLYGSTVQILLVQYWGAHLNPLLLFLLALPFSLGLAWISWHLVESPALRRKPKS